MSKGLKSKQKIKVNNSQEGKEVQELLFQLGCEWDSLGKHIHHPCDKYYLFIKWGLITWCEVSRVEVDGLGIELINISLQKLRYMVFFKSNYKIKVNNESDSKEVQELFFELGAKKKTILENWKSNDYQSAWLAIGQSKQLFYEVVFRDNDSGIYNSELYKEITIPQLRDMVVLHRNDENDATHEFASGSKVYVSSDDVCYEYIDSNWVMFTTGSNGVAMKPIKAEAEQGLINGVDAFNYKMAGEAVLWKMEGSDWQDWTDCTCWSKAALTGGKYSFKIKPKTVKIEIEIPTPFEPKVDEFAFYLDGSCKDGFDFYQYDGIDLGNPLWRSSEEIKQVVAALRNGIKGVDNV